MKIGKLQVLLALALIGYAHQALAGCSVSLGSIQKVGSTGNCTLYQIEAQAQNDVCYCHQASGGDRVCYDIQSVWIDVKEGDTVKFSCVISKDHDISTSCYDSDSNYVRGKCVQDIVICPPGDEVTVTAKLDDIICDSQKLYLKAECPPDQCCETNTSGSINVVSGRVHTPPQTDFILKGTGQEWPFTRYYYTH